MRAFCLGSVEPRHRHPHGLSVYLASQDTRITIDGQAPQVGHREAGSLAWSDAVVHTVQNVGTTPMHVLRIELKHYSTVGAAAPADGGPAPTAASRGRAKPQNQADFIGNLTIRIIGTSVAPRETVTNR